MLVVVIASSVADYDTKVWLIHKTAERGAQGGSSCHQAKWTVNIFTVRVISSLDLFQQGLPEGSIHWPPGMTGLMHTKAEPSPLHRLLQTERRLMFSPLWEHSCTDRSVRLHKEYAEFTHLKRPYSRYSSIFLETFLGYDKPAVGEQFMILTFAFAFWMHFANLILYMSHCYIV